MMVGSNEPIWTLELRFSFTVDIQNQDSKCPCSYYSNSMATLRDFKIQRRDGNENVAKK